MCSDRKEKIIEELFSIRSSLSRVSDLLDEIKKDRTSDGYKDVVSVINGMEWFPPVGHEFTNRFAWGVSNSFKINRMVDKYVQSKTVSGDNYINTKDGGMEVARRIGLLVPHIYQQNISTNKISPPNGKEVIIKPVNSSTSQHTYSVGVEGVKDFFSGRRFSDFSELHCFLLGEKKLANEKWVVTDFLKLNGKGAHDVKFYCFYGEVSLVLQMDRTGSSREVCFFNSAGEVVNPGKYRNSKKAPISTPLFSHEDVDLIKSASLKIPAPFTRIDMLATDDGLYFCEFTFNSGSPGGFSVEYDKVLGVEYRKAKNRLFEDFLTGTSFQALLR